MAKLVVLPSFLITIEEFNQLKDPPLRNLKQTNDRNQYANPQMISYKFNEEFKKKEKIIRPFKQYCCDTKEFVLWIFFLAALVGISSSILYGWKISLIKDPQDW